MPKRHHSPKWPELDKLMKKTKGLGRERIVPTPPPHDISHEDWMAVYESLSSPKKNKKRKSSFGRRKRRSHRKRRLSR